MVPLLRRCRLLPYLNLTARLGTLRIPIAGGLGEQLLSNAEPWLDVVLERLLAARPGSFVDVGVNIGQTLVKVLKADPARQYWGFEPNPAALAYVSSLVRLNAIGNVHLVCGALSDHNATEALFLSSPCDSSASIVEGFRPSDFYRAKCSVLAIAGDQFFDAMNVHAIAILKIDVEGGELEVLRGLRRTIMRTRPFIICEVLPVYEESTAVGRFRRGRSDEVVSLMRDLNYRIARLAPDGRQVPLNEIETHSDLALTNYLFVPGGESPI
jgi:FkbM family methyltransferase